jgi:hypothetical protein
MSSEPGKGTVLTAEFQLDHIDRMPLGDLKETLLSAIVDILRSISVLY